jgi:predicted DNA-binding transcriptional regulator YafY
MPHAAAKENVERIRTIVALVRRQGAVSMRQLQDALEAHVSTIKRDHYCPVKTRTNSIG